MIFMNLLEASPTLTAFRAQRSDESECGQLHLQGRRHFANLREIQSSGDFKGVEVLLVTKFSKSDTIIIWISKNATS